MDYRISIWSCRWARLRREREWDEASGNNEAVPKRHYAVHVKSVSWLVALWVHEINYTLRWHSWQLPFFVG